MATITYTLGELKGSIGNLTFQRNSSGKIVRVRPRINKSSTSSQQKAHSKLFDSLYNWQLLTNSQKDSWNTYANTFTKINKFGQEKKLTGLNWFTSTNFYNLLLGNPLFTNPPPHTLPPSPPSFEILLTETSIKINFTSRFTWTTNGLIIWSTLPNRKNTNSINTVRRLVTVIKDEPMNNIIDITSLWETSMGITFNTANFPNANIFVCLESVSTESGITSPLICNKINSKDMALPYKIYSALLNQDGTSAPVATILQNTIGNIVWSRMGVGNYNATLIGAFTINKTTVQFNNSRSNGIVAGVDNGDGDSISIGTANTSFILIDSNMYNNYIEIRVYD